MGKRKKELLLTVMMLLTFLVIYIFMDKRPGVLKEIKRGKHFLIEDEKVEKQLDRMISSASDHVAWIWRDLNKDGILELLLAEKERPERIIGIFAMSDNKASIVLWDDADSTEYYELCDSGLLYYYQYYGIYDKESYALYRYDSDWNKELVKGLEVYCIEDIINVEEGLEEMSFIVEGKSNYYFEFWREDGKEQQKELTQERWLKEYANLFGKSYQGVGKED